MEFWFHINQKIWQAHFRATRFHISHHLTKRKIAKDSHKGNPMTLYHKFSLVTLEIASVQSKNYFSCLTPLFR